MCYFQNHLHEISLKSSIFAFVQEQQNAFANMARNRSARFVHEKSFKKGSCKVFAMLWYEKKAAYNYSLKNACLELYTTPIMQRENLSDIFCLCGNNDLEMCLHVLYAECTHGTPISNRLFWMSCLPSMVMQSWMHNSIRQPAWAHCRARQRETSISYCGEQTFACVSHKDWGN